MNNCILLNAGLFNNKLCSNKLHQNKTKTNYSNNSFNELLESKSSENKSLANRNIIDYKERFKKKDYSIRKVINKLNKAEQNFNETVAKDSIDSKMDEKETLNSDDISIEGLIRNIEYIIKAITNKTTQDASKDIEGNLDCVNGLNKSIELTQQIKQLSELLNQINNNKSITLNQKQNLINMLRSLDGNISKEKFNLLKFIDNSKTKVVLNRGNEEDNKDLINLKSLNSKSNNLKESNFALKKNILKSNIDNNSIQTLNNKSQNNKVTLKYINDNEKQTEKTDNIIINDNSGEAIDLKEKKIEGKLLLQQDQLSTNELNLQKSIDVIENNKGSNYNKVTKEDIIHQIVEKSEMNLKANKSEMVIQLKPDSLGKILLKVEIEKGIIVAKANVENYQVKQLIEANITELRTNLNEHGIEINRFDVEIGKESNFGHQSSFNWNQGNKRQNNKSKKKINSNKIHELLENIQIEKNTSNLLVDGNIDLVV